MRLFSFFLSFALIIGSMVAPAAAQVKVRPDAAPVTKAAEQTKPTPEQWLSSKGQTFLQALSEKITKTRYVKTKTIAEEVLNQSELARLAMGKYWREFNPQEQDRYKKVFIDYFIVTYASAALPVKNVKFKITDKRISGQDILLKTSVDASSIIDEPELMDKVTPIANKESKQLELIFAIRERQFGYYYIRDIQIEGQSMLLTLRKELEGMYAADYYVPATLLERMEANVQKKFSEAETLFKQNR